MKEPNRLVIPLVIVSVLLVGSLSFAVWAFAGMQDYKNNVDAKIAEAVTVAEDNLTIKKDAEFAEKYKDPNTVFKGPSDYGTLTITYPKNWSNYLDQQSSGSPVDGFMELDRVNADKDNTNYALRYQVLNRNYDQELKAYESRVRSGKAKITAYRLPKVESALGVRVEGELDTKKSGVLIIVPLRDKTIKVWTEGDKYRADFEKILESLAFIP